MSAQRIFLFCLIVIQAHSQEVKKLKGVTDLEGSEYNYVGQVENKKANGFGIEINTGAHSGWYLGHFRNGAYDGHGILLHGDSVFWEGEWKDGKQNGLGSDYDRKDFLYVGPYFNNHYHGSGIIINSDKSFEISSFRYQPAQNDKSIYEGRSIQVNTDVSSVSDIWYQIGNQSDGYRYNITGSSLERINKEALAVNTASFSSFLTRGGLKAYNETKLRAIGSLLNGQWNDTCLVYDFSTEKRFFGRFEQGQFREGLILTPQSVFIGSTDKDGATGYGYYFEPGKTLMKGYFKANQLEDPRAVIINFHSPRLYYEGPKGKVPPANGILVMKDPLRFFMGTFHDGYLIGKGSLAYYSGRVIKGTWEDGGLAKADEIQSAEGHTIPGKFSSFCEALNAIIREYPYSFNSLINDDYTTTVVKFTVGDFSASLVQFPGADPANIVGEMHTDDIGEKQSHRYYRTRLFHTNDFEEMSASYTKIAESLKQCPIKNERIVVPVKFNGSVLPLKREEAQVESVLDLPVSNKSPYPFQQVKIYLGVEFKNNQYVLRMLIGDKLVHQPESDIYAPLQKPAEKTRKDK